MMERFLNFMAQDMANHPQRLTAIDVGLAGRIQTLVETFKAPFERASREDDYRVAWAFFLGNQVMEFQTS